MIGALRQRVDIESVTLTADAVGGLAETWAVFATVWAEVKPVSGREYFSAHQVNADVTHRVTIRYLEGIDPKMRVVHRGRYLGIKAVLDDEERGRYMHLLCLEESGEWVYTS